MASRRAGTVALAPTIGTAGVRRVAAAAGLVAALVVGATGAAPRVATAAEWRTYAGGPRRLFMNPREHAITAANVSGLRVKWTFPTGAPVTASPSVASIDVPGEGRVPVAFIQSWDHRLYALRVRDGTAVWTVALPDQPGASYPNVASVDVRPIDGALRLFVAAGETVYSLDATTGAEVWRFSAGTGCTPSPGLCGFFGERNEVESSPIVAGGNVVFGMDVNEENGKGGFFAVDARDGRLAWYFDLVTAATCRPLPGDDVRRFDGYHTETELGLPAGFFASRPGCDFARSFDGCGNTWSSASVDARRGLLFFGSGSCDRGDNGGPFEEAIVALRFDGTPAWRWRPRPVDPLDLDFGGVPNLFTIVAGGRRHDVVGLGGKDGTYYVVDRDGVNAVTGARWDDADASALPYWRRQVVPGGSAGGIIATAAVDERARRVYFSTAPGEDDDLADPQEPTVHALDADTGAIAWQNTTEPDADASFGPTSAIPGVVFAGKVVGGQLRAYDAATGTRLAAVHVGFSLASAPAIVDGTVLVGAGTAARSEDPTDPSSVAAMVPQNVTALCARGTRGCDPSPLDRCRDGGSAPQDARDLAALRSAVGGACACAPGDVQRQAPYVRCVADAVAGAIADGRLRAPCRHAALATLGRGDCPAS